MTYKTKFRVNLHDFWVNEKEAGQSCGHNLSWVRGIRRLSPTHFSSRVTSRPQTFKYRAEKDLTPPWVKPGTPVAKTSLLNICNCVLWMRWVAKQT